MPDQPTRTGWLIRDPVYDHWRFTQNRDDPGASDLTRAVVVPADEHAALIAERDRMRDGIERALRIMGDTREHERSNAESYGDPDIHWTMGTRYIDAEGILRAALGDGRDGTESDGGGG